MTDKEKLEELARLQRILEDVKEWGYGRVEIEIQDNKIVFAIGVKKYKF